MFTSNSTPTLVLIVQLLATVSYYFNIMQTNPCLPNILSYFNGTKKTKSRQSCAACWLGILLSKDYCSCNLWGLIFRSAFPSGANLRVSRIPRQEENFFEEEFIMQPSSTSCIHLYSKPGKWQIIDNIVSLNLSQPQKDPGNHSRLNSGPVGAFSILCSFHSSFHSDLVHLSIL